MADISHEMKRLPLAGVQPSDDFAPEARIDRNISRDEADLLHFGKRQQFKVGSEINTKNFI